MRNRLVFLVVLSLTSLALAPSAVAERSASYTTGADALASCEDDSIGSLVGGNYGSACFEVPAGSSSVDATIDDLYLDGVGGALEFQDADGDVVGDVVPFCGSVSGADVPDDAERLEVLVNGPVFELVDCQQVGSSTFGDVIVDFS